MGKLPGFGSNDANCRYYGLPTLLKKTATRSGTWKCGTKNSWCDCWSRHGVIKSTENICKVMLKVNMEDTLSDNTETKSQQAHTTMQWWRAFKAALSCGIQLHTRTNEFRCLPGDSPLCSQKGWQSLVSFQCTLKLENQNSARQMSRMFISLSLFPRSLIALKFFLKHLIFH